MYIFSIKKYSNLSTANVIFSLVTTDAKIARKCYRNTNMQKTLAQAFHQSANDFPNVAFCFCSHQCASKTGKGPAECSQSNMKNKCQVNK